jgi:hypothetical protein
MKKLILPAILFTVACTSVSKNPIELGSLKGNVFWKYNNYVGNKPDAGSTIRLYSVFDTTYQEAATTDVQDNYVIDSIPSGEYVLIVASKATTESPSSALTNVYINGSFLKFIARDSLYGLKASWDSTIALARTTEVFASNRSAYEKLRIQKENEDSTNHIARRWFNAIPADALYRMGKITSSSPKVKYEIIIIKPKRVETVITDFGITYY